MQHFPFPASGEKEVLLNERGFDKYHQNINTFQKHQQNINDLSTKYQQITNLKNSINIMSMKP